MAIPSVPTRSPIVFFEAAIAEAASLSEAVDMTGYALVGISMPAGWTAADITFQAGSTPDTLLSVYDHAGTEVAIVTAASRYVTLDAAALVSIKHLKIRSGTAGTPVNQVAARTLTLVGRAI